MTLLTTKRDRCRSVGRAATRPALVALAGFSLVTGVVLILSVAPNAWSADAHRNLLAARAFLDGTCGTVDGYLYSPLAAALTVPALAVPEGAAVVGWLLLKVAVLLIATRVATRGLPTTGSPGVRYGDCLPARPVRPRAGKCGPGPAARARARTDRGAGSAGTIVVAGVAVLLPSVLVGGTGPWIDAAPPA